MTIIDKAINEKIRVVFDSESEFLPYIRFPLFERTGTSTVKSEECTESIPQGKVLVYRFNKRLSEHVNEYVCEGYE